MNLSLEEPIVLKTSKNISTKIELERFYEELFTDPTAKCSHIFLLILIHIIGPILLSGIITYEKYGGDPQKRNIINRLQSTCIASLIIRTEIHGIVIILRETFGLIDLSIMIWIECLFCMFICNAILCFAEMSVLHLLYTVVWKRVKDINDEFWACFLISTTSVVSFWEVLVDHIPNRMLFFHLMIHTANSKESFEEIRYRYTYGSVTKPPINIFAYP